jgi:hypothetical protein
MAQSRLRFMGAGFVYPGLGSAQSPQRSNSAQAVSKIHRPVYDIAKLQAGAVLILSMQ